ncbi:uncharacterized protein BDZ99DRAFT_386954 [Mytilinidion resinicola]|uniref:Uncharacterized protein n=1 Tax=Mytilinidion resinicola TaxID=574789 RepID=A0A6A6YR23_9PEZI|nr:uncharacterized protein BDZ99DRAFT_386954 [Mytilinidion resinicola]KAF2810474.1 hypothetical protein BDZ99DRAFT_386954 [Mytilinidion resinicola]
MATTAPRPPFNPVDTTSAALPAHDEVESPSLSSTNALARFEFETGHGREGTKILMVEWEDSPATRRIRGDWHVSWEGKSTVLSADDQPAGDINRMYFLLAPGAAVPPVVVLTHRPRNADEGKEVVWHTNPLPAIFPPELGANARAAGKKGILHTIWAKKRLQVLNREIERETRENGIEGIGLEMASQEKEWIESTFGVAPKPMGLTISLAEAGGMASLGPASPRTPGGGRLMEKLRGLKLGTSERDLGNGGKEFGGIELSANNPLSPESSDVAVSSFAAFKGANPLSLAAKPPQRPVGGVGIAPPHSIVAQQEKQQQDPGMASLNATFASPNFESRGAPLPDDDDDREDGLFALPISPRSPEMTKSPFSFAQGETTKTEGGLAS